MRIHVVLFNGELDQWRPNWNIMKAFKNAKSARDYIKERLKKWPELPEYLYKTQEIEVEE